MKSDIVIKSNIRDLKLFQEHFATSKEVEELNLKCKELEYKLYLKSIKW